MVAEGDCCPLANDVHDLLRRCLLLQHTRQDGGREGQSPSKGGGRRRLSHDGCLMTACQCVLCGGNDVLVEERHVGALGRLVRRRAALAPLVLRLRVDEVRLVVLMDEESWQKHNKHVSGGR